MSRSESLAGLIDARRLALTPAERRVAEVVLAHPQLVAFGTVAQVAALAHTSGATVVRLAAKLGLDGFTRLQSQVQTELASRLRPATEKIREHPPGDQLARAVTTELDNLHATLDGLDRADYGEAVQRLASAKARIFVLPGDASRGVGIQFGDELTMLRDGVTLLGGTEVGLARELSRIREGDVVVVIDLRRYERWVISATGRAKASGAWVLALSDSALSPLADLADRTFVVHAAGAGPFDSHVGTLALANALVAGVAGALRASATTRLDRIEAAWVAADALVQ